MENELDLIEEILYSFKNLSDIELEVLEEMKLELAAQKETLNIIREKNQ